MTNGPLEFVREEVRLRDLSTFARLTLQQELPRCQLSIPVSLRLRPWPLRANGLVSRFRGRATITINALAFRKNSRLTWFYLYATIVHELEHLRLMRELEEGGTPDLGRLLAGLCQQYRLDESFLQVVTPRYAERRRSASLPELLCTQVGFQRALAALGAALSPEERTMAERMLDSLNFMAEHLAILYGNSGQPYQLFSGVMLSLQRRLRMKPAALGRLRQLSYIFTPEGVLLSPQLLFERRTPENQDFYDAWLLHLFLMGDMQWEQVFSDCPLLRLHMETLANDYCMRSVRYLQQISRGSAFFSDDILQDNAAMLVKDTQLLNALMKRHQMQHTGGTVLSLQ